MKEFRIGDTVWSVLEGKGAVTKCGSVTEDYPIYVRFKHTNNTFTNDGRRLKTDKYLELYDHKVIIKAKRRKQREIDWNKVPRFTPVLVRDKYLDTPIKCFFIAKLEGNSYPYIMTSTMEGIGGIKHYKLCEIQPDVKLKKRWYK